jgi:hypothetical protein
MPCGIGTRTMKLWDEPLTDEKKAEIVETIAGQVMKRGLSVPAILFLEMHKPLARVAANASIVFSPFIIPFTGFGPFDRYSQFFEERTNVEAVIRRIEELEAEKKIQPKDPAHATR